MKNESYSINDVSEETWQMEPL